jgi:hypothetical protein
MSPWTYLLSGLAVVVVMLCCLFPLAPYPVRAAPAACFGMSVLDRVLQPQQGSSPKYMGCELARGQNACPNK